MPSAPFAMEHCPIEIWEKIVSYACTDGGCTGCSLSLVSRSMRDIVQPYRYQTVALTGVRGCVAFARELKELRAPLAIHYLLVSVDVPQWGENQLTAEEQSTFNAALTVVIHAAAPTLRTFTLREMPPFFDLGEVLVLAPFLENLSIPFMHHPPAPTGSLYKGPQFPSLRRLHLSHCSSTGYPDGILWDKLSTCAPSLTHLRLTYLEADSDIALFLRVLLDVRDEPEVTDAYFYVLAANEGSQPVRRKRAQNLPGLKHIFVQPAATIEDEDDWCGSNEEIEWETKTGLSRVAKAFARGDAAGEFYLMPETNGYSVEEARADWLDLIQGGQGPWQRAPAA